jgi:glucose/mannose-6-phosphate isomerase
MRRLLLDFHKQVAEASVIGRSAPIPVKAGWSSIVVTGLGGSAIGGDILRSYTAGEIGIPVAVNRTYALPAFADETTLVIVSSYSGDTEETVASYADAVKRRTGVLCITSGGEVARMAARHRHPLITIPRGLPPRAALGYSFFPMLIALERMKLIPAQGKAVAETIALLKRKAKAYSALNGPNTALEAAKHFYTKLPVVYSASDRFDAVNLRWRGQLAENAKVLSLGHVLPEMNHNELVGWKVLRRIMQDMAVVFLADKGDHKRVRLRARITKEIAGEYAASTMEVASEGTSLLARIFSLIVLGDWTSFYLAVLNGVDPTPVKVIDYLKHELSKVK